ncbi:nuclear transport factor 2 family protein [Candidatus Protochlamydia phocaeensis]|uniref:nuclear transport factor 2 family protein n=1 Tax=Candidatus Protochlamydia phocaeensis TaxID=1414722 RepID=UPI000838CAE9|nr:nuclear transport factor 2 family protein [Candidatus Protochlamydia phocaeensis]
MEANHEAQAEDYYKLIGEKNAEFQKYLHPDVEFYGPLATLKGKGSVIEATSRFMQTFKSLAIRAKFGAGDQAMIVYEVDVPGIAKDFPGASLLSFREGLIARIQLFYDGSRFVEKKEEIFSKN